jgi:hypothetical protein
MVHNVIELTLSIINYILKVQLMFDKMDQLYSQSLHEGRMYLFNALFSWRYLELATGN